MVSQGCRRLLQQGPPREVYSECLGELSLHPSLMSHAPYLAGLPRSYDACPSTFFDECCQCFRIPSVFFSLSLGQHPFPNAHESDSCFECLLGHAFLASSSHHPRLSMSVSMLLNRSKSTKYEPVTTARPRRARAFRFSLLTCYASPGKDRVEDPLSLFRRLDL
jgi:hypothetical protein